MASNIESPNLSRRGFVFAAGTAALAAAGAGLAGCAPAAIKEGEGNAPEKKAVPDVFTDGTYITHGTSMHGPIDVKTVIEGGAIASVAVLNHNESRVVGEHAIEKMPQRIVESQCVDADAITGATVTSMAIKNAVVDAVIAAGGDPDDFSGYAAPAPTPRTVEKSADVAIMGAGPAGLMAAWAAAEKGKSVVICERMGYTGGCTPITGGGIYTQETQLQRAWGLDLVPETHSTVEHRLEIYAGRMQAEDNPYYNPDMPFIRTILESSSRAVDKMLGIGVAFCPMGESAVPLFAPGDFQIGGKFAMEIVTHYVTTQLGVEIITEAPVTALDIQDGRAVGFTAEGADGTVYEVTAKAVVLASGGYIMNDELMHEYQPDDLKFPLMGPPWATGDGMLLAKDAGAAWICMDKGVTSHYHAGVSLAETSYIHYCVPGVVVNGNGERFVSESISYIVALRKFKEEPTTDFYWVFDDPASYGLMPNGNASRIDYSFLLETGDIVKGENYEDLAEKTGLFGLVATLDTVNDCAVNGAEDPFGNENLPALQLDGPMYAMKILPTPYIAQGGVKVDLSGHVQREDDSLIEGLYAVGDVTGALENRDGADYMIGLTQAVGYGLVVGETVAADLG